MLHRHPSEVTFFLQWGPMPLHPFSLYNWQLVKPVDSPTDGELPWPNGLLIVGWASWTLSHQHMSSTGRHFVSKSCQAWLYRVIGEKLILMLANHLAFKCKGLYTFSCKYISEYLMVLSFLIALKFSISYYFFLYRNSAGFCVSSYIQQP